ncbi:MAG: hypothetical protein NUW37_19375 [Planctomycetes bacterium]|nr:hypothetical protein [Planctomycetota bacterium]
MESKTLTSDSRSQGEETRIAKIFARNVTRGKWGFAAFPLLATFALSSFSSCTQAHVNEDQPAAEEEVAETPVTAEDVAARERFDFLSAEVRESFKSLEDLSNHDQNLMKKLIEQNDELGELRSANEILLTEDSVEAQKTALTELITKSREVTDTLEIVVELREKQIDVLDEIATGFMQIRDIASLHPALFDEKDFESSEESLYSALQSKRNFEHNQRIENANLAEMKSRINLLENQMSSIVAAERFPEPPESQNVLEPALPEATTEANRIPEVVAPAVEPAPIVPPRDESENGLKPYLFFLFLAAIGIVILLNRSLSRRIAAKESADDPKT